MKFTKNILFPAAVLLTIILVCYGRTLGSYFLADDFSAISYAAKICSGQWDLLLANFTGNSVQVATMKVYRPWLLISIVCDFIFWRANAFGYYLTNILYMFGSSMMLYAVLRELTKFWHRSRSIAVSLLSATLFVSSPLHSESISFVVGRVDIICSFYFLASLWCFLKRGFRSNDRKFLSLGILCFWLAILTKEMAITLPVLVFGMGFLFPKILGIDSSLTIKEKLLMALRFSLPLWISTVIYFVIRYFALGTFVGGYTGSIGANQWGQMLIRWSDLDTLKRILYPLSLEVFGVKGLFYELLTALYFLLGGLFIARLFNKGISWRWIGLIVIWILTALIPIYQLWGLGYNLEGERFLFFLTAALAIVLPICLLSEKKDETTDWEPFEITCCATLIALIVVNAAIAFKNNIPWVHAGKQTRACLLQAEMLAKQLKGSNKRIILLGLPSEWGGTHMILNGATFRTMLAPPYCSTSCAEGFITFAPIFYGNYQAINTQRFKQCLNNKDLVGVYAWDENKSQFQKINLLEQDKHPNNALILGHIFPNLMGEGSWSIENGAITIRGCKNGSELLIALLKLNPYQYDFVEYELANSGESFHIVRLPLSNCWKWFTNGYIDQVRVSLPASEQLSVRHLKIVSAEHMVPKINIVGITPSNIGVYEIKQNQVMAEIDAKNIPGSAKVKLEISKPNFFFENVSDKNSDQAVLKSLIQEGNYAEIELSKNLFPEGAYYQIRGVSLDKAGSVVGEKSDPVTIYISK